MKNRISNTILHKAFSTSLCFILLSGLSIGTVSAQENNENEEGPQRVYAKKRTQKKDYEMKTVEGIITDDATGEAMGGVRVQAYGLEDYSTLTEEDGSYKLEIPTFSDAVYVTVEGYTPMQIAVKDGKASGKLISTHFNSFYNEATTITSQRTLKIEESSGSIELYPAQPTVTVTAADFSESASVHRDVEYRQYSAEFDYVYYLENLYSEGYTEIALSALSALPDCRQNELRIIYAKSRIPDIIRAAAECHAQTILLLNPDCYAMYLDRARYAGITLLLMPVVPEMLLDTVQNAITA